ncbi:MAG: hypothetical protein M0R76_05350 [Proteobacteria bacterium]|nr:hypothetical protein [Pseudomonadota bacterium]
MKSHAQSTYRTRISPLHIVIQLIALGGLIAAWNAGQIAIAACCALLIVFTIAVLPRLIRRAEMRFQKQAILWLTSGRAEDVIALARRQILLQLFGATAPVDARMGLALCELERFAEAIPSLENALPRAPQTEAPALIAALTRARFVTGDPIGAEKAGRTLLDKYGVHIGETALLTARARIAQNKRDNITENYIKMAEQHSRSKDEVLMCSLVRIEWELLNNRLKTELPADADSRKRFVQVWVHYIRGRIREHRGQTDEALKVYARAAAAETSQHICFADLARERIKALGKPMLQAAKQSEDAPDNNKATADASQQKRKKKRR